MLAPMRTCILLILFWIPALSFCESPPIKPQENLSDYELPASPKTPWTEEFITSRPEEHHWWAQVLLWPPNRVLDFIDIFKLDVGIGPTAGVVIRVTQWGQAGYRQPIPFSLRGGLFGRRMPFLIETSNEIGLGLCLVVQKIEVFAPEK